MSKESQRSKSARQQLSAMCSRLNDAVKNAGPDAPWPYTTLPASTRLFASSVSENVMRVMGLAAEQLGLQPQFEGGAIAGFVVGRRDEDLFSLIAQQTGAQKDDVATARYAAFELYRSMAADMLRRIEACLEGDQTIDGREIKKGPLHDK